MKKIFIFIVLLLISELATVPSTNIRIYKAVDYTNVCRYPLDQRSNAIDKSRNLFTLNEKVLYIIDQALIEQVDPLDVLSYFKIENPYLDEKAINKNYTIEKKYDRKQKKWIKTKILKSTDIGLGQLNTKHIDEFVAKFWIAYGETEKFNPYNYKHNTRVSIRLFKSNLKTFDGNVICAVMAYNAGVGKISSYNIPQKTLMFYIPLFNKYRVRLEN